MLSYVKLMKKRDFKTDAIDASPEKGIRKEAEEVVRRDKVSRSYQTTGNMF